MRASAGSPRGSNNDAVSVICSPYFASGSRGVTLSPRKRHNLTSSDAEYGFTDDGKSVSLLSGFDQGTRGGVTKTPRSLFCHLFPAFCLWSRELRCHLKRHNSRHQRRNTDLQMAERASVCYSADSTREREATSRSPNEAFSVIRSRAVFKCLWSRELRSHLKRHNSRHQTQNTDLQMTESA